MPFIAGERRPHTSGEKHWKARLTPAQVAAIRAARQEGQSLAAVAKRFRVSESHVSRLARGLSWREAQP